MLKAFGIVVMVAAIGLLAYSFKGKTRSLYLPGTTTSGHYQIELACEACHKKAFADHETLQEACVECHGAELKEADDSHPEAKFTDPRNADRVAKLDARRCVTCHREHRPELVSEMGLSLPTDYCYRCHEAIGTERPSHAGLGFDTCAEAACHNFHDNRALYEDYLSKHLDEPDHHRDAKNPARAELESTGRLTLADTDAPSHVALAEDERKKWASSAHAVSGVNCTDCHAVGTTGWQDGVAPQVCAKCHERETEGYRKGRHGMREAQGLEPMRVVDARVPMKPAAKEHTLGCASCHGAHDFDTRRAAVQACLQCHDDEHSRNYEASRHASLWRADPSGRSGASCATCHLPRIVEGETVSVLHNQNDTLRPNEKMVRPVCVNCHGVGFSLASLADGAAVSSNFGTKPSGAPRGLQMVRQRLATH